MKTKINIRFIVLCAIVSLLGIWRIVDTLDGRLLWNFTPIGAMALFAGYYFAGRYKSYIIPLSILFISDVVLMQTLYSESAYGLLYKGWYWTYGSFMAMTCIGSLTRRRHPTFSLFIGGLLGAVAHYGISNFGVWVGGGIELATGQPYTHDINGLVRCYIAALPFFKNMLISTLFFGTLLFGGFELAQWRFSILKTRPAPNYA